MRSQKWVFEYILLDIRIFDTVSKIKDLERENVEREKRKW